MSMLKYCEMIFDPNHLALFIIEINVNIISVMYVRYFISIFLMQDQWNILSFLSFSSIFTSFEFSRFYSDHVSLLAYH